MTMANGLTSADRKSWEILAGIVGEHYMNDTTTTFDTPLASLEIPRRKRLTLRPTA